MRAALIALLALLFGSGAVYALPVALATSSLSSITVLCQNSATCINKFLTTSATDARHFETISFLGGSPINSIFDGAASARASFGSLGSSATLALTDYRTGSYIGSSGNSATSAASGVASFTDYLTIHGATGNGILHLLFDVDGTLDNGGSPLFIGSSGRLQVNTTQVALPSGDSLRQFDIPFTFEAEFQLAVSLFSLISLFDNAAHLFPDPYSWSGSANFLNTAEIVGLSITTTSGQPITGATVSALSGTVYGAVPEPGTLSLALAGGMLAFVFIRRSALQARPTA